MKKRSEMRDRTGLCVALSNLGGLVSLLRLLWLQGLEHHGEAGPGSGLTQPPALSHQTEETQTLSGGVLSLAELSRAEILLYFIFRGIL